MVDVVERPEPVFVIEPRTAPEWGLFAYHIGNRHQPLMITDRALVCPDVPGVELLLQQQHDPAYARAMLPFTPGDGRSRGHQHSTERPADRLSRLLALLHLCDSLFPIGGFAYSDGLEAATASRRDRRRRRRSAAGWTSVSTRRSAGSDGPTVLAGLVARSASSDWDALAALDEEITALRPSSAARRASRAMGLRLLTTWQALLPGCRGSATLLARARDGRDRPGAAGRVCGGVRVVRASTGATSVEAFAYTRLAATVSAAMRLMPIGQTEAHRAAGRDAGARAGGRRRDAGARRARRIVRAGDGHRRDDAAVPAFEAVSIVTDRSRIRGRGVRLVSPSS